MPLWYHENLRRTVSFVDLIGTVFAENREPMLFAMVLWALWNRRNNLRLGKNAENLDQLLQRARARVSEFPQHNTARGATGGTQTAKWQPPGPGQYKVNVDGALFAAENTAGLGVVIRDEHGQVMVSLSERIPLPSTVIEVEVLAARRGMELAVETSFRNIVLESDSQILIKALREDSYSLASFGHIVKDIQVIASYLSSSNFYHVRRQCNGLAHFLARRAKNLSQSNVWMEEVPPDISSVLQADLFGLL